MFKYTIPILCLLVALGLSICTGYISVIGLMFIFSGIWIPFALIELAKLVTTVVLHKHWNHDLGIIKWILTIMVIVSMGITSMGVFGYLSKASTTQKENVTLNSSKLDSIELSIKRKEDALNRNTIQIDKYNEMLNRLITDNVTRAAKERKNIQVSIKQLEKDNKVLSTELDKLHEEALPFKKELSKHEVEIGPLLYLTKLVYKDDYKNHSEDALIYLIAIIMVVLDPMAILLLIASQKSFYYMSKKDKDVVEKTQQEASTESTLTQEDIDIKNNFGFDDVSTKDSPEDSTEGLPEDSTEGLPEDVSPLEEYYYNIDIPEDDITDSNPKYSPRRRGRASRII